MVFLLVVLSFNAYATDVRGGVHFDNRGNVGVSIHFDNRHRGHTICHTCGHFPVHSPLYCQNSWIRSGDIFFRSCHVNRFAGLPPVQKICYDGVLVTVEITQFRYDEFVTIRESYNPNFSCR